MNVNIQVNMTCGPTPLKPKYLLCRFGEVSGLISNAENKNKV